MSILNRAKLLQKQANATKGIAAIGSTVEKSGWPLYHKIGTGLGVTSLGLSTAAYVDSRRGNNALSTKVESDQKALVALQKIHNALTKGGIKVTPESLIVKGPADV